MLALIITFAMNNFVPNWMFKPFNENPNINPVEPSKCRIIEGEKSSVLFGVIDTTNNRYTCQSPR